MTKKILSIKISMLLLVVISFNNLQAQQIDSLLNILDSKYLQEKIKTFLEK